MIIYKTENPIIIERIWKEEDRVNRKRNVEFEKVPAGALPEKHLEHMSESQ